MSEETVPGINRVGEWMHPTASLDDFEMVYHTGSPIHRIHAKSHGTLKEILLLFNTNSRLIMFAYTRDAMPAKQLLCNFHFSNEVLSA
jgi:hypothetical protein